MSFFARSYNVLSCCFALFSLGCLSACTPSAATPAPGPLSTQEVHAMPTQEQMQAAWKKASTTTAEHAFLKELSGKWRANTKMWMAPGEEPVLARGHGVNYMTLGGKFLRQDFSGSMLKKPFSGFGFTGFDTVSSEFTSVWMDSLSTSMMVSTGSYDSVTKTLSVSGLASCPMMGRKIATRSVTHIIDRNHHTFEMYASGDDGKEFKSLEINYVRLK